MAGIVPEPFWVVFDLLCEFGLIVGFSSSDSLVALLASLLEKNTTRLCFESPIVSEGLLFGSLSLLDRGIANPSWRVFASRRDIFKGNKLS